MMTNAFYFNFRKARGSYQPNTYKLKIISNVMIVGLHQKLKTDFHLQNIF